MSFLKKEDEPQKFISLSDVITLLVIGGLVGGGYLYYKWVKKEAETRLTEVLKVYENGTPVEALKAFESLENLQWKSDSLDSIIYEKQSELYERSENQKLLLEMIEEKWKAMDTAAAIALMKQWKGVEFLSEAQVARVKEFEKLLLSPTDSSAKSPQ